MTMSILVINHRRTYPLVMCCGIVLHTLVVGVGHFQSLDSFSFVLGSEAYSSGLLRLIKDFVLSV